jgi:hypothetical protein
MVDSFRQQEAAPFWGVPFDQQRGRMVPDASKAPSSCAVLAARANLFSTLTIATVQTSHRRPSMEHNLPMTPLGFQSLTLRALERADPPDAVAAALRERPALGSVHFPDGSTLLELCLAHGRADWIELLAPLPGCPLFPMARWMPALNVALSRGIDPSAFCALLDAQPNLSAARDDLGCDGLILAARAGAAPWIQALAPRSDQSARNHGGYDALAAAVFHRRDPQSCSCLFPAWGARRPASISRDALGLAFALGFRDWANALLPWREPGWSDARGFGPAHACALADCDWGPALLGAADFQTRNHRGNTALLLACSMGHRAACKALISRSDPLALNDEGKGAMELAPQPTRQWLEPMWRAAVAEREREALDQAAMGASVSWPCSRL